MLDKLFLFGGIAKDGVLAYKVIIGGKVCDNLDWLLL